MNSPRTRRAAGVAALRYEAAGRPPEPAPMSGRGTRRRSADRDSGCVAALDLQP